MVTERWTDEMVDQLAASVKELRDDFKEIAASVKELRDESKELNIRFSAYQQSFQQVVNLAFGLLATATITTIVTAVLRK